MAASHVLVTGANRGIGLELVRQLLRGGSSVLAACRTPANATELTELLASSDQPKPIQLDVSSEDSIAALPARLDALGVQAVSALVHNAGVAASTHPIDPVQSASKSEMMRCFEVNCCGPLLLTQTLLPQLQRSSSGTPRVLFVGSDMGCVSSTNSGGAGWTSSVSYRCSKAAVHMLMRCFHEELAVSADEQADGVCFAAVHPGWVQTDMGGAGGRTAHLGVEESVVGVLQVLHAMAVSTHGGRLFNYDGQEMVW